ncbi:lasso peptide biosynthesis B2 protein [Novosphingobium sp.]|uniref:lasso peptide biosynthesis B2 protein n=1 Tax=Novosphingobium sp. TaxID=1874826 RepID=UPI0025CBEE91|nr:lasso peptide biosynthesis B2 protein [Novosphingobium sp.]
MAKVRWWSTVAEAMILLAAARLLVAAVALRHWRFLLGDVGTANAGQPASTCDCTMLVPAVERAAARLPFHTKCLPRATALHVMYRRRKIPSKLVIGVLDPRRRGAVEDLHAWVESGGAVVIGAIAEPFHPIIRFG